jgi:dephospho-CoA kinase
MGKTTAADVLRQLGVKVHDADAAVHRLLARGGGAVAAVEAAFPGVVRDGAVDRLVLGERVFGNARALDRLESILHPMVREESLRFLQDCERGGEPLAVLEVPLLFETGRESDCDVTILVSAPPDIQTRRVMRRPDMTPERLAGITARQMPDREKRRRADFVVETGLGRAESLRAITRIVKLLKSDRWRAGRRGRRVPASKKQSRHA